ncbi:GTP pyrophosphokinase [Desulfosediminicola flagellatus]|uniref:GTP pyrophosphokinase n=1 Tax=Desulfosediminicola flagellatus TaxID=2569541 RepID=UPI0010AD7534|nr:(p)ppGpp synthetase [Desulfosediminicola flagellatus]
MASLDFEQEKLRFRTFYEAQCKPILDAKNTYIRIINALIQRFDVGEVTRVEGRIKDREECIKKFHRKYQNQLEAAEHPYEIKDFISDLIGIRIVCLYEDQIPLISELLQKHFRILDVTDKTSSIEKTEDSFGYKGLHMDLAMNEEMGSLPRYQPYAGFHFEIQIRSLIQDAWGVLDHKIKYKKSIPNDLKRRINVLSALFELADREFKEIRNATDELMQQETVEPLGDGPDAPAESQARVKNLNAFNFLRIAGHFFRDFEFQDYKVDGFVQDILRIKSDFQKAELHRCLRDNLKIVKEYRDNFLFENPDKTFSPYTSIRHCLFLCDQETFARILSKRVTERFTAWLKTAAA